MIEGVLFQEVSPLEAVINTEGLTTTEQLSVAIASFMSVICVLAFMCFTTLNSNVFYCATLCAIKLLHDTHMEMDRSSKLDTSTVDAYACQH